MSKSKRKNKRSLANQSPGKHSLASQSPGKHSLASQSLGKVLAGGPARNAKRIVLAGGCFDILHYGHIHFLKKAKALGTYLVVALESDKNIKKLKGEKRPFYGQNQRREMLESLNFIDQVIILGDEMKDEDYDKFVGIISPQIIAVTEGDPIIEKKRKQAEKVGAKIVKIPKISVPSTTQIAKLLGLE